MSAAEAVTPTVGVIFGGASSEHAISVRSARAVLAALDETRFEPLCFGVTRQGTWLQPIETEKQIAAMDAGAGEEVRGTAGSGLPTRLQVLKALAACDIVFPLIHGRHGEDGTIQGLLELAGLPYVGAGVAASAIAMDKAIMKRLFHEASLPTLPYQVLTWHNWRVSPAIAARAAAQLSYPVFVKPAQGGSSIATTKVHHPDDLDRAVANAFRIDRRVLIEHAIDAREIECAVLGNADAMASPLGEIRYQREFYDYVAKYEDQQTELVVPAHLPIALSDTIRAMALDAYRAIDCAGMGRVDFLIEKNDTIWLSEINTIPGFTSGSMFPRLWEEAGVPFPELVSRLVELALEQYEERSRRATYE